MQLLFFLPEPLVVLIYKNSVLFLKYLTCFNFTGAALENMHTIESTAHNQASIFLESHSHSIQALEAELRAQAEARQHWSTEQIQAEREHVTTQISALQAAHVQAQATMATLTESVNQLSNVFSAALQSALQQVS